MRGEIKIILPCPYCGANDFHTKNCEENYIKQENQTMINYEDLKKLLPREKEGPKENDTPFDWGCETAEDEAKRKGANEMLAEVTDSLPLLVEYIYADLREKLAKKQEELRLEQFTIDTVLEFLTPNKE